MHESGLAHPNEAQHVQDAPLYGVVLGTTQTDFVINKFVKGDTIFNSQFQ